MDSGDQLTFWPTATVGRVIVLDEWPVSDPAARLSLTRRDDITVTNEWTSPENWELARNIILSVGAVDRSKERSKSNYLLANAPPASIAALLRIALAPRESLSLEWLSAREHIVTRLIMQDVQSGRARRDTKSLASSFMRISREVFRRDLFEAWARAMSRALDHVDEATGSTQVAEKSVHFIPSPALVEIVKDGFRSHSESYSRLVEPRFIPEGLALLRNEDISEFIATRMWRLMLSLADHAAAEGKGEVQFGNRLGFLDKIDHLILDRIPVSPKDVTPFLKALYEEYKHFAEWGQTLPGRGRLWSNERGLFCKLDKIALDLVRTDKPSDVKTEVFFE
jgi:hypothetical protein